MSGFVKPVADFLAKGCSVAGSVLFLDYVGTLGGWGDGSIVAFFINGSRSMMTCPFLSSSIVVLCLR